MIGMCIGILLEIKNQEAMLLKLFRLLQKLKGMFLITQGDFVSEIFYCDL